MDPVQTWWAVSGVCVGITIILIGSLLIANLRNKKRLSRPPVTEFYYNQPPFQPNEILKTFLADERAAVSYEFYLGDQLLFTVWQLVSHPDGVLSAVAIANNQIARRQFISEQSYLMFRNALTHSYYYTLANTRGGEQARYALLESKQILQSFAYCGECLAPLTRSGRCLTEQTICKANKNDDNPRLYGGIFELSTGLDRYIRNHVPLSFIQRDRKSGGLSHPSGGLES